MIIRPVGGAGDIEQALEVYLANEAAIDRALSESIVAHWTVMRDDSPGGFWVAEDEEAGRIVGLVTAIRRPPQWILCNYYVLPGYQGQGLGKQLLAQAFSAQEGCDRYLVHASDNPSAQCLYLQSGMYPQPYSILFHGSSGRQDPPEDLIVKEYPVEDILPKLNNLDEAALGFIRPKDHRRWDKKGSHWLVEQDGQVLGYFRVSTDGLLGPLVVSDERWMGMVLEWAIHQQQEISDRPHEVFVPGANHAAIQHLLTRGYRFRELNLLMSSHPMPGLAKVIFHDMDFL
jgi:GNAT superfamily N-acetyltransferase